MKDYISQKKFHCGEIVTDIIAQERIQFDGVNVVIRGEKKKAPTLMSAIRAGWLTEATVDADGKPIKATAGGASANMESPAERAARLKQERLNATRGAAGNGQFLEDTEMKKADKKVPIKRELEKDSDHKVVPRNDNEVKTNEAQRKEKKAKEAEAKEAKKSTKLEVVTETEGTEVSKVKSSKNAIEEDKDQKSFYQAMLEGEVKKLDVSQDQFVQKKAVIKLDSQDEAVEIKKLVSADEITASKDPLKTWPSMTVNKKEAFLKKATDAHVVEQIVNRESGALKRKAEAKLSELKSK